MSPEEAEELAATDRAPLHYYTGHVVQMGPNGIRYDPHRFVVRAPTEWQAADKVREVMGLSDRDAVYMDQQIGFDDA